MITAEVTLARLLDEHPELLEVLAGFHPHFRRFHDRLLRQLVAPRVTVSEAARMAGVPAEDLLDALRRAAGRAIAGGGQPEPVARAGARAPDGPGQPAGRPGWLASVPETALVRLDVRDDIARGAEPFGRIMAAVRGLGPGRLLVLRAPFEPVPLYEVLGRQGFAHWTEPRAADDWEVWFYRPAGAPAATAPGAAGRAPAGRAPAALTLDVRGLEPPQPMVLVLEQLDRLGAADTLLVLHERRPLFLYPQLEARGFAHETREAAPGLVEIRIRRGGPGP